VRRKIANRLPGCIVRRKYRQSMTAKIAISTDADRLLSAAMLALSLTPPHLFFTL
jgi:hypothetical protein